MFFQRFLACGLVFCFLFSSHLLFSSSFFLLPPTVVVTQIRGHTAGSSPPSPPPHVPCIFIARKVRPVLPSSIHVELHSLLTFLYEDTTARRQSARGKLLSYLLELNRPSVDRRPLKPRCGRRPLHEHSQRSFLVSSQSTIDGQCGVVGTLRMYQERRSVCLHVPNRRNA